MSLQTFPYVDPSDAPRVGGTAGTEFRTSVTTARSGIEKRRKEWTYPRHSLTLDWSRMENAATKADALFAFHEARGGKAEPFVVFDFSVARSYAAVRVAVATAGQTVFNLPCRNATSVTVKVNGTTTAGTLAAAAGANGRDKFTFGSGLTAGDIVTVDFTGQRAYVARFDTDVLTIEYLTNRLHGGLSFPLVEVRGEE